MSTTPLTQLNRSLKRIRDLVGTMLARHQVAFLPVRHGCRGTPLDRGQPRLSVQNRWLAGLLGACAIVVLWGMLRDGTSHSMATQVRASDREAAVRSLPEGRNPLRPVLAPARGSGTSSAGGAPASPRELTPSDTNASERVTGRVVDALGGAIAGALVSAIHEASQSPFATTTTAADGAFELRAPPGPLRIMAASEGYGMEQRSTVAPAGGLLLSLAPGTRIFGRVVDTAGAVVSGATVHARALWRSEPLEMSVLTDAAGEFRFEALSAGEHELSAWGDRSRSEALRVTAAVADAVGPVELRVLAAVEVALGVERGGRPCAGGWVQLSGERFQGSSEIVHGSVLFETVPRGEYRLSLACEQAAPQLHELSVGDQDVEQTIHLAPGQALRGRVLSAPGEGVEGALVTVSPAGLPEGRAQLTCLSGAQGDFLCEGLSVGGYRCHAGLELQPQTEFVELELVAGAEPAPLELHLWPRAQLVVSLADAPADQLSGVRLSARPEQGLPIEAERRGDAFHFDGLLLGSYSVSLVASPATRRDVVLERDGQRVELTLPWPATRSISGVVLDERGSPAVEVWVRAASEGSAAPFVMLSDVGVPGLTDSAGRFTVEGLFEGRYHLRVEGPQGQGSAQSVPSGTSDALIQIEAAGESGEAAEKRATAAGDPAASRASTTTASAIAPPGALEPTNKEESR